MALENAPPANQQTKRKTLDLKWSLTLRVVAVALICFLVAAALAVYGTYREARQVNENIADIVVRQMQMQLFRIESHIDTMARFPDWDPVVDRVQGSGQCIEYLKPDGSVGRSSCVGVNSAAKPPAWVSSLGAWLLGAHADSVRTVSHHGKTYGTLLVSTETSPRCGKTSRGCSL
jgi:hypothetical protein